MIPEKTPKSNDVSNIKTTYPITQTQNTLIRKTNKRSQALIIDGTGPAKNSISPPAAN